MIKETRNTYIIVGIVLTLLVFLFLHCTNKKDKATNEGQIAGVKIYDYDGKLPELFNEWHELGINTIFSSVSLYSNDDFRSMARKSDITTYIIIPIFFNPEALEEEQDLYAITDQGEEAKDEWVKFVCPSRKEYRDRKINSIRKIIRELDPGGLSIDFIRHFVFWEKVYPERTLASLPITCFCSSCLTRFQTDTKISIPDSLTSATETADWIKKNYLPSWTEWKCNLITSMVQEITAEAKKMKPDIMINVHIIPWGQNDFEGAAKIVAGQDFSQIAPYADFLSPMTYAHMVKREPSWIHSVVQDVYQQTSGDILPGIQVKEAYLEDTLSINEFRESLKEALKLPSRGVVFWSWDQLEQDPQKKDVIRAVLKNRKY